MTEKLQAALCRLLESQDQDTVNHVFTEVCATESEYAKKTPELSATSDPRKW